MTDLHTHILPAMDDGARDEQTSLAMLAAARSQGVERIALTPHFYREDERPGQFLARREKAWDRLRLAMERVDEPCPELVLGAEVTWIPGLHRWEELEKLCLGGSGYLLLELPDSPWRGSLIDQVYDLADRGDVTPVLAHLDRYFQSQRPDYIRELLSMGIPVQISAQPLLHLLRRGKILRQIRGNPNCMLISDCHDLSSRPPNLGPGMARIKRSVSPAAAHAMEENSRRIFELAAGKESTYASK